jgi:hypothetical protein
MVSSFAMGAVFLLVCIRYAFFARNQKSHDPTAQITGYASGMHFCPKRTFFVNPKEKIP